VHMHLWLQCLYGFYKEIILSFVSSSLLFRFAERSSSEKKSSGPSSMLKLKSNFKNKSITFGAVSS
jgi:hypothetical protein